MRRYKAQGVDLKDWFAADCRIRRQESQIPLHQTTAEDIHVHRLYIKGNSIDRSDMAGIAVDTISNLL